MAQNYEATDWEKILLLYDLLFDLNPSPVIAFNRAVALGRLRGPEAGLTAMQQTPNRKTLKNYYLFYAVLAEFFLELKRTNEADENLRCALSLTSIPAERNFLEKKLRKVTSAVAR